MRYSPQTFPFHRSRLMPLALGAAILSAGMSIAPPVAAAQAKTIKLRYRLSRGNQFTYLMTISGNVSVVSPDQPVPPIKMSGKIKMERTVVEVHSDGRYTFQERMLGGDMTMTMQGVSQTAPIEPTPPQFTTVNALGRITLDPQQKAALASIKSEIGFDPAELFTPFTALQAFPMEPLRVNSKWQRKASFKIPSVVSVSVVLNNKLARMKKVNGVSTAEVVSYIHVPVRVDASQQGAAMKIGGQANGGMRTHYSLTTGMPVKMSGSVKGGFSLNAQNSGGRMLAQNISGKVNFGVNYTMQMLNAERGVDTTEMIARKNNPPQAVASASGKGRISRIPKLPIPGVIASPSIPGRSVGESVPTSPLVELKIPSQGGAVSGLVPIHALVGSQAQDVSYVAFNIDGARAFVTNARPFRFNWDTETLPSGIYKVSVELYGASGQLLHTSPARQVQVRSDKQVTPEKPKTAQTP